MGYRFPSEIYADLWFVELYIRLCNVWSPFLAEVHTRIVPDGLVHRISHFGKPHRPGLSLKALALEVTPFNAIADHDTCNLPCRACNTNDRVIDTPWIPGIAYPTDGDSFGDRSRIYRYGGINEAVVLSQTGLTRYSSASLSY